MRRLAVRALTVALIAMFVALGVWQVERRAWKLGLIARTEAKLAAAPVAPPPVDRAVGRADEYTRLVAHGRYVPGRETYVQATTELGGGYWVMTPLDTRAGRILVNRGFVPPDRRGRTVPPAGAATVAGLLRLTEPGGGILRANAPAANRWYSRDIAAIARAQRLGRVAPYFVDAGAIGDAWPRGGLTVVRFRNSHLAYALTWFAMAGLLAGLAWRARRAA